MARAKVPGRIQAPHKELPDRRPIEHPRCSPRLPRPPRRSPAARCSRLWSTNQRVDALPVAPDSAAIVRSIGLDGAIKADFGSGLWEGGPIGIPYDVVGAPHAALARALRLRGRVRPRALPDPPRRADRGRAGRRRRPPRAARRPPPLPALRAVRAAPRGRRAGRAGSGATWSLRRPRLRPSGWTSADAAGLPILPLLARYQEVRRGRIRHALRMTVSRERGARSRSRRATSPPTPPTRRCRGWASGCGSRRRSTSPACRAQARVVARAMKEYGLIVADNGSDWFVSGAPHPRWDNDQLRALGTLRGSDFEVVRAQSTCTRPPLTVSRRRPASSSSSSSPTSSRRQPRSVRTSGSGRPRRAATTIGARSARAAISS